MPLAFGGVQIWATVTQQSVIFIAAGLWQFKLFKTREWLFKRTPLDLPLFLFLGIVFLQLLRNTTAYYYATKLEFFKLASYCAIFFLITNIIEREKQVKYFAALIVFIGFFEALYGIVQHMGASKMVFFYKKVYFLDNVTGTYINRNHFAGYLEMAMPLAAALALEGSAETSIAARDKYFKSLFFSFLTAVIALGLLFSGSRAGIISGIFSMTLLAILSFKKRRTSAFLTIAFILITALLFYGAKFGVNEILRRFSVKELLDSASIRFSVWRSTLTMIKDRPVFGWGLGTFVYAFPKFASKDLSYYVYNHAHNDYLELFTEGGVCALAVCLSIFIIALSSALKRGYLGIGIFCSLLSLALHSFTDFNLHIPANAFTFVLLSALLFSLGPQESRGREKVHFSGNKARFVSATAIVLFGVLFVFSAKIAFAQAAYNAYLKNSDRRNLKLAIFLEPSNAQYRASLGDSYFKKGDYSFAERQFSKAIDLLQTNAYYRTRLARIHDKRSERLNALTELKLATRLSPNDVSIRILYAEHLLKMHEFNPAENLYLTEALREYRKAIELDCAYLGRAQEACLKYTNDYDLLRSIVPSTSADLLSFARYLENVKMYEQSRKAYEEAVGLASGRNEKAYLYFEWAAMTARSPDFKRALVLCDKALDLDKNFVQGSVLKADILRKLGEVQKAQEILKNTTLASPDDYEALKQLINTYDDAGMYSQSIQLWNDYMARHPDDAKGYFGLGLTYQNKKEFDKAFENYEISLKLAPANAIYRNHIGTVYYERQRYNEAIFHFEKVLKLYPRYFDTLLMLARVYVALNEPEKSAFCYKRAIAANPNSEIARREYGALGEASR